MTGLLASLREARQDWTLATLRQAARCDLEANHLQATGGGNTLAYELARLGAAWCRLKAAVLGTYRPEGTR